MLAAHTTFSSSFPRLPCSWERVKEEKKQRRGKRGLVLGSCLACQLVCCLPATANHRTTTLTHHVSFLFPPVPGHKPALTHNNIRRHIANQYCVQQPSTERQSFSECYFFGKVFTLWMDIHGLVDKNCRESVVGCR